MMLGCNRCGVHWAEELVFFWLSNVSPFAVGVKHVAFAAEQEWRLFQYCQPEEKTKFQFRQRPSFMSHCDSPNRCLS
jgi:hypothetical protein